jgi:hypothetical protein
VATPEATSIATVSDRNATPVLSADYPHTSCTNRMRKKNTPNMAVPTVSMMRFAPSPSRSRSSRTGSSAWRLRASMTERREER